MSEDIYEKCKKCGVVANKTLAPDCPICLEYITKVKTKDREGRLHTCKDCGVDIQPNRSVCPACLKENRKRLKCKYCTNRVDKGLTVCADCKEKARLERSRKSKELRKKYDRGKISNSIL